MKLGLRLRCGHVFAVFARTAFALALFMPLSVFAGGARAIFVFFVLLINITVRPHLPTWRWLPWLLSGNIADLYYK